MGHGQTYKRSVIGSILGSLLIAACVVTGLELIERSLAPLPPTQASAQTTGYALLAGISIEMAQ